MIYSLSSQLFSWQSRSLLADGFADVLLGDFGCRIVEVLNEQLLHLAHLLGWLRRGQRRNVSTRTAVVLDDFGFARGVIQIVDEELLHLAAAATALGCG